ncbi:hypothetical protein FGG08_004003 [Glutinoglossum americanum]|uniref:Uncharacterized protein n=1 Tax=Glutinoglossum americanum TaxID=1670608 RepID=A0A9P8I1C4_9PEZI|nr:hypothetical protein FGG08_004003 [Glutinoglossum americanum]
MDPNTALFTFMLQTPPNINSAHLVGSWDNFKKRYPMEKDVRKGRGHWKGCHTFENIICDGELDVRGRKRDGGLKMGGKYWYYFELDGEIEIHNPTQPSTNSCPFLPGQPTNILDVPIETGSEHHRNHGRSSSLGQLTLNPADKYTQPRPAPKPKPPRLSTSPASLRRRPVSPWRARQGHSSPIPSGSPSAKARNSPFTRKRSVTDSGAMKSFSRTNSLRAAFLNTRGSDNESERDYGGETRDLKIGNPVLISRSDEGRHCIPISAFSRTPSPTSPASVLPQTHSPIRSGNPTETRPPKSPLRFHPVVPSVDVSPVRATSRDLSPSRNPILDLPLPPLPVEIIVEEDENEDFDLDFQASPEPEYVIPTALKPPPPRKPSFNEDSSSECLSPNIPDMTFGHHTALKPEPLHIRERIPRMDQEPRSHFSIYSNSSAAYSPSSANTLNSPMSAYFSSINGDSSVPDSPCELPTPFGSEFAEEDLTDMRNTSRRLVDDNDQELALGGLRINTGDSKRKAACFGFPTFKGYSLPEEENSSQDTLRKTATLGVSQETSRTTFGPAGDGEFLQSLSESEQGLSTLEELLNDLGYLGDSII